MPKINLSRMTVEALIDLASAVRGNTSQASSGALAAIGDDRRRRKGKG